jgi:hypothetical protein
VEEVIPLSSSRPLRRVECSTDAPEAIAIASRDDATVPSGAGVHKFTAALSDALSGHAGVEKAVFLVPGAPNGTTWDLTVYGYQRATAAATGAGVWLPIVLWQGECVCDAAPAGDVSAAAFDTGESGASGITTATGVDAQAAQVVAVSGTGVGHALVDARGCPYLYYHASDSDCFVLVGGLS